MLALVMVQFGCNQGRKPLIVKGNDSGRQVETVDTTLANVPETADLAGIAEGRPSLIAQLKAIHRLLATDDRRVIARLFTFPMNNDIAHLRSDDSSFRKELDRDGGFVTSGMFIRHFSSIASDADFHEYNKVFQFLNVDSLLHADMIEVEDDTTNSPCVQFYRINIEGDSLVRISYGFSTANPNYKSDHSTADELNDDGTCEKDIFWVYLFDGRRLHLVKRDEAD